MYLLTWQNNIIMPIFNPGLNNKTINFSFPLSDIDTIGQQFHHNFLTDLLRVWSFIFLKFLSSMYLTFLSFKKAKIQNIQPKYFKLQQFFKIIIIPFNLQPQLPIISTNPTKVMFKNTKEYWIWLKLTLNTYQIDNKWKSKIFLDL